MRKDGFYARFVKRAIDCVGSLTLFILFLPLLVVLYFIVAWKMGPPVIFRQMRSGYKGKRFSLIKFRSMTDARDKDGNLLPDEDRLPRFGQVLRKTSLDELPQLINIFLGHMSLVGPRPLIVEYDEIYTENHKRRLDVRPGLTGLSAVRGRNAQRWRTIFDSDVEYVDKISLALDLQIIWLTFLTVVKRSGVDRPTHYMKSVVPGYENEE